MRILKLSRNFGGFRIQHNSIIAFNKGIVIKYNLDLFPVWNLKLDVQGCPISINTEMALYYDNSTKCCIINTTRGEIASSFQNLNFLPIRCFDNEIWGQIYEDDDSESQVVFLDLKMNLHLTGCKIGPRNICGLPSKSTVLVRGIGNKILLCFDIAKNVQLWQFDVSDYGIGEPGRLDIIEVYQNIVLLKSSNHFIGLDLNTGTVVWHETLPYSSFYPAIGNGKVYYGLMGYSKARQKNLFVYFVLDILTGAILHESDQDAALFDNNTQFTRMAVYGDEITFTTQNSNKTYILDSETGSLKCVVEAPKEEVSYFTNMNTAILHQNRLYLTDSEGTLFVFERETTV